MKNLRRWIGAVLVACVPGCSVPSKRFDSEVDGRDRVWRLYVPANLPPGPAPLVVALHGGGGTSRQMERFVTFDALADKYGFLVVYPEGLDRGWNDGRESAKVESQANNIDDGAFIIAMIDEIAATHAVDPKRVFATGISNGGFMSQYLANRFPGRFAAIAPVVGGIAVSVAEDFGEGAVAVMIIQGTADPLVPYDGGEVANGRGFMISTDAAAKLWVKRNGCGPNPLIKAVPDTEPEDGCRITRTRWTGGTAPVELWTVHQGGHTWPSGTQYLPAAWIGPVCRDVDGCEVIWKFFSENAKP